MRAMLPQLQSRNSRAGSLLPRLREARDTQVPVLYFLGVAPQRYTLLWPTYVATWLATDLKAQLAFGAPATSAAAWTMPVAPERRYALRLVRQRLHQATFREAVLTAYGNRCAISGLPEARLLDAAHYCCRCG